MIQMLGKIFSQRHAAYRTVFLIALIIPIAAVSAQVSVPRQPQWRNDIGQPGIDHWVWSLTAFGKGEGSALYAGGWFSAAGGRQVNHIAKWDGKEWWPLGSGMNGFVHTLAVFDDG